MRIGEVLGDLGTRSLLVLAGPPAPPPARSVFAYTTCACPRWELAELETSARPTLLRQGPYEIPREEPDTILRLAPYGPGTLGRATGYLRIAARRIPGPRQPGYAVQDLAGTIAAMIRGRRRGGGRVCGIANRREATAGCSRLDCLPFCPLTSCLQCFLQLRSQLLFSNRPQLTWQFRSGCRIGT